MQYRVELREIDPLTQTVFRIRTDRPEGYEFRPGQYTELSIDRPGYSDETRPLSFTSHPDDPKLEFIFRSHRAHAGVTAELALLAPGAGLLIEEAGGTIEYRGPGCFIAGGTGITPFVSIFRCHGNDADFSASELLFSNKTERERFLVDELTALFGDRVRFSVTHQPAGCCDSALFDVDYLRPYALRDRTCYVCGPDDMVKQVNAALAVLGIPETNVVLER